MVYERLTAGKPGDDDHIVRPPRSTDAVGQTLRHAFGNPAALPEDMRTTIERLDGERRRSH